MEPAVFRPVRRGQAQPILLGGGGGLLLGLLAGVPPLLGALFGAVAAAIAFAARHAGAVRLVASADRLELRGRSVPFSGRWEELRLAFGLASREGGDYQRYAVLADAEGRSVAFGVFAGQGPCRTVRGAGGREVEVLDLEGAPVLLALLVQKVPAWQVLPVWLQEAPAPSDGEPAEEAPVAGTDGLEEVPVAAGAVAPPPPVAARRQPRVGLLTLVAKLGSKLLGGAGKLGAGAVKAAKGTNLAMAAASAASFSLLFNWKVALLLLLQLFIHEYGHLHAMRRTGMRVRGLYFVPFMGALTVSEDAYTSRRQQAYVALSGPLWGGLATAGPLGLFLLTGEPLWAGVASLWAALNLFNLLPFSPLDGGRVLSAFANSYSSGLGVAVTVLGLAGVVALGVAFDFSLIWIVALLGGVELLSEARARAGGRAMRLLPDPDLFQPIHYHHLRAVLGPPPAPLEQAALSRDLVRMAQAARVEPMGARQILGWGLAYAGLAVGLVALVYFTRHLPGGAEVAKILS